MKGLKIISGGQTGVDQGALDFALYHGWPCGGWCPSGRECESGRIPEKYPLHEVDTEDYNERTRRNVLDADATLVITASGLLEKGTALTISECKQRGKPLFHLDLEDLSDQQTRAAARIKEWLHECNPDVLNMAGNRESNCPGMQNFTFRLLELIFF